MYPNFTTDQIHWTLAAAMVQALVREWNGKAQADAASPVPEAKAPVSKPLTGILARFSALWRAGKTDCPHVSGRLGTHVG